MKKKLVLHIGTEKTGTTSIQESLYANRNSLIEDSGVYFMQSLGEKNNQKLPSSFMALNKKDNYFVNLGVDTEEERIAFKEKVLVGFDKEFNLIPKHVEQVVISSEHFQSRLTSDSEVEQLFLFLKKYFSEVKVVCYVREQYSYFLSSYSTKIKSGRVLSVEDYMEQCNSSNPFFNHYIMLEIWSRFFGKENIIVKEFKKEKLLNGDVVEDFYSLLNLKESFTLLKIHTPYNESLNNVGIYIGIIINSIFKFQTYHLKNKWRATIRSIIINRIITRIFTGKIKGYDYLKPKIDAEFKDCNEKLIKEYINRG
ncbi:hypothetical protein [Vibrio sp. EA2]|uniref:hypothetical protein n=1 Tax=Vibrio sp. EA2 TaxID=3079860 RepID=UPI002949CF86|nr:hypothetical protein [Vibrio sp. EA2]MDV6253337.1 hypothetical protein [Vibrio sp. EA2]